MKYTLTILFSFFITLSFAQIGNEFPDMEGYSLTDELISIPDETNGKYSLVGIAFSKKAEDDLKSWFQPIYEAYVMEADANALIPDMRPDVNVVFIPMFTGIKRGASKSATKKMQEGIDEKLHPHVMVYSGAMGDYDEALALEDKEKPYFFILDKAGKIIYATAGKANSEKLGEIDDMMSDF
ncbi:MAG: hypothetical protein ACJAT1_000778 [Marivirga sp.]|jgi:hypothetical protein